jgi:hypothetical protein
MVIKYTVVLLFSSYLQLYKTYRKNCVLKLISNLLLTDNLVLEKI